MHALSIYGAGHLTESLLAGLAQVTDVPIRLFNRTPEKRDRLRDVYPRLVLADRLADLVAARSFVFVIIPSAAILDLPDELIQGLAASDSALVSCAYDLSLSRLAGIYPGVKLLRALPNINWRIRLGVTLVQRGTHINDLEWEEFTRLLAPISELSHVEDDAHFQDLGMLTSCAGGMIAAIVRAICPAFGVTDPREQRLCYQSLYGSLQYLLASGKSPEEIIREVANPGGLTEVGVASLAETLPPAFGAAVRGMGERREARREKLVQVGRDRR
jgi:pyrroline-5-carboxylate reductase